MVCPCTFVIEIFVQIFFAKILKIKYYIVFFPWQESRALFGKKSLNMTDEWTTEGQSFVQCIFAWPIVIYTFETLNVFNFNFWMQIILHSIFCLSIILNCLKTFAQFNRNFSRSVAYITYALSCTWLSTWAKSCHWITQLFKTLIFSLSLIFFPHFMFFRGHMTHVSDLSHRRTLTALLWPTECTMEQQCTVGQHVRIKHPSILQITPQICHENCH